MLLFYLLFQCNLNNIDWDVTTVEYTEKDDKILQRLRSDWYGEAKDVTTHELGDDEPEFSPYDPSIKLISQYVEAVKLAKKAKRGTVSYRCPLCETKYAPGRKDAAETHLHGRQGRSPINAMTKT